MPSAFNPDPFMLTMDTEKAKIEGLKMDPCAGAPGPDRASRRARRKRSKVVDRAGGRAARPLISYAQNSTDSESHRGGRGSRGALALTCAAQTAAPAAKKKQVKDQGEFEIYNQAIKDATNPAQRASRISTTWAQKYPIPTSKTTALYMYMQAYSKSSRRSRRR